MKNMSKEVGWLLREKYDNKPTEKFKKDVERLKVGEPLDYVIGFTNFLGCKIDLRKKPLIPRPETEFWVELALQDILKETRPLRILDVFAGSGCIGISIVRQIKRVSVVFADKEKQAIEQIKINCKLNNIPKASYKVIQSDIFSNIAGRFDYIFANPPYIPTTKKNKIQKSVLHYEPHQALFGGGDGLVYIKKFLVKAHDFLNPRGRIYMEFDSPQKKAIEKLFKKLPYKTWEFHKDQYGKYRWITVQY